MYNFTETNRILLFSVGTLVYIILFHSSVNTVLHNPCLGLIIHFVELVKWFKTIAGPSGYYGDFILLLL